MGLPRPHRTKFALSLKEFARLTGESLSALKRQSISDPHALRLRIETFSSTLSTQSASEVDQYDELFAAYDKATRDIIGIYFACVHLGWHDETLRARLKSIFDITRPYIEEPEG